MRYITASYVFDQHIEEELRQLHGRVVRALQETVEPIVSRTIVVLTDQNTWDPRYYSVGPQTGEKYDLDFSGQFLNALRTRYLAERTDHGFNIGIGDIPYLDSLKSAKGYESFIDAGVPYWRVIVYGRPAVPGYSAYWSGETWGPPIKPGKPVIGIKRSEKQISPIEPSHMFENTYLKIQTFINMQIYQALRKAVMAKLR